MVLGRLMVVYQNSSLIGLTLKSASGIGRPCGPGSSLCGSRPSPLYSVAATSPGVTGRDFGAYPNSSDSPTTVPPLIGPPPIRIDHTPGWWSRPPAGFTFGVRPNSPSATTIVL